MSAALAAESPLAPARTAPAAPPAARRLFGTDGVRGVANAELSPRLALDLGAAAARVLRGRAGTAGNLVVIGRDPRVSGDLLGAALTAGLLSQGVDVLDIGVVPTPGVSFVTRARGALAGVVISASHNPVQDNGIKFFGGDGRKLADDVEAAIEAAMEDAEPPRPTGGNVGRVTRDPSPVADYTRSLADAMGGTRLSGMRVLLDCANGAASYIAANLFHDLGAEVAALSAVPDGVNINDGCGSLYPEKLAEDIVASGKYDAGLAFDGDADRVILVDEKGRVFDGDRILYALGVYLKESGRLTNDVVVGTIMSNLGLEAALTARGIRFVRAAVGDRYVAEQMGNHNAALGGEKSGHILLPHLSPTGDGLLTGLQVLRLVRESGRPLSSWADAVTEFPQKLVSVRVRDKAGWDRVPAVAEAIARGEATLAGKGRLNVRPSGTEKLIRVMAEGPDAAEVDAVVADVAGALRAALGV